MIVLSYLGPLALVPLLVAEDRRVRWHALHGLVLFVAALAAAVLLGALSTIRGLGCLYLVLVLLLPPAWLALAALCVVQARQGRRFVLPGLTALCDRLPELSRRSWLVAVALVAGAVSLWLLSCDGLA